MDEMNGQARRLCNSLDGYLASANEVCGARHALSGDVVSAAALIPCKIINSVIIPLTIGMNVGVDISNPRCSQ